jgi:hypothetical protein
VARGPKARGIGTRPSAAGGVESHRAVLASLMNKRQQIAAESALILMGHCEDGAG